MADNQLADKIGELGTSLASIKEQVGNLATDFTTKLAANGEVSAELKEKTDKALSELGDVTTRLGEMEKRAARENEIGENEQKSLGDLVIDSSEFKAGMLTGASRGSIRVKADRAAITSANTTVGAGRSQGNAYLTQVIALSDMPIRGLVELWVNGERVTLGVSSERGQAVNEYPDSLWIKFYDGTQTTADSFLFSSVSNGNRWWNPDRIGRGVAYAIVTARVSKNMFSGVPSFKFVLDGMRLYDISRDSTQGGVGTHRYADPATWGGDGDFLPAVQIYNLLRGISYNGQWFYGLQNMAAARLPALAWIAQIEKHRAGTLESTGWVNTYRSGGEVQVEAPLTSAVEALLTACQGKISEVGGVYYLHSGAPDAPVIAFTDDDILSTEEQEFTPFLGLADTINGVSANYPSPQDGWVSKTAPPLYRTDLEAIDGNRRLMADVDLNFVPYPSGGCEPRRLPAIW
ncbi:hypothetical protein [Agrobacterium tumefaciens]|uniref:hypothetical protein n=1 Tax=Agrobacterium tumefaciens TaxID=358 RepID=UPI003B9F8467